jgi:hypothetical protein
MDLSSLQAFTLRIHLAGASPAASLGSAFVAPILDPQGPERQFALSAYHVVAEAHRKGEALAATKCEDGREVTVRCIPVVLDAAADFAVLRLVDAPPWTPVPCSDELPSDKVVAICGHASGLPTFSEEAIGEFRGLKRDNDTGQMVLAIVSAEVAATTTPNTRTADGVNPRDVWSGISGGAAVALAQDRSPSSAIGIVKTFSRDGVGGRVYCIPMRQAAEICLRAGLCLDVTSPVADQADAARTLSAFLVDLDDPDRERLAWDGLSDLFFARVDVERQLHAAVAGSSTMIRRDDKPFVEYFLGRIFLKKGDERRANQFLASAVSSASGSSAYGQSRLRALVNARLLASEATTGPWKVRFRRLDEARQTLEGLHRVPDAYIGAELASLIGWECQGLFSIAPELPPPAIEELQRLVSVHESLLVKDPRGLPKQAVVSTAMAILTVLWRFALAEDTAEILRALARRGRSQARARRNSIFFVQMVLVDAIASLVEAAPNGLSLLLFAGNLMRAHRLTILHEGVSQLVVFLGSRLPEFAVLFDLWIAKADGLNPQEKLSLIENAGIDRTMAARAFAASNGFTIMSRKHAALYEADFDALVR